MKKLRCYDGESKTHYEARCEKYDRKVVKADSDRKIKAARAAKEARKWN